jgi:hypothetical protein
MNKADEDRDDNIDIGDNHWIRYLCWKPDRSINPQYEGIPDVEKYGAIVGHLKPDGKPCEGAINFDSEVARKISPNQLKWTVESWEPLTLSPSLQCGACPDHGFIRGGKWVRA